MKPLNAFIVSTFMLYSSFSFSTSYARQLFSLTLLAPNEPVKTGSELSLTITVTNTSDHNLSFGIAPGIAPDQTMSYNIEIRDTRGQEAPPTPFLRDLREHPTPTSGSVFGYTLTPGNSYKEQLVITRLYVLRPGKYTIQVARSQEPRPNTAAIVKSNTITITVDG